MKLSGTFNVDVSALDVTAIEQAAGNSIHPGAREALTQAASAIRGL